MSWKLPFKMDVQVIKSNKRSCAFVSFCEFTSVLVSLCFFFLFFLVSFTVSVSLMDACLSAFVGFFCVAFHLHGSVKSFFVFHCKYRLSLSLLVPPVNRYLIFTLSLSTFSLSFYLFIFILEENLKLPLTVC